MTHLRIDLYLKPLSYNKYYRSTRSGNRVKTGAGLAYDEQLDIVMEEYSNELKAFGCELDLSSNIVIMDIQYFNPEFFIKDGSRISKTAGDLDNMIKILQDKIFRTMEVDDSIVRNLSIHDVPSNGYKVVIDLLIQPIPDFYPIDHAH